MIANDIVDAIEEQQARLVFMIENTNHFIDHSKTILVRQCVVGRIRTFFVPLVGSDALLCMKGLQHIGIINMHVTGITTFGPSTQKPLYILVAPWKSPLLASLLPEAVIVHTDRGVSFLSVAIVRNIIHQSKTCGRGIISSLQEEPTLFLLLIQRLFVGRINQSNAICQVRCGILKPRINPSISNSCSLEVHEDGRHGLRILICITCHNVIHHAGDVVPGMTFA
mmetsp:Transcript_1289/g.1979  ORF Transcript_1289/g.1979 Transcript_1289/m.1979 type:complete len:224 (-) Transcript_1289:614-1285(-)